MRQRLRHAPEALTDIEDGLIMALWKQGMDTYAIAKHLHVFEWQVANRLLHLRDQSKL